MALQARIVWSAYRLACDQALSGNDPVLLNTLNTMMQTFNWGNGFTLIVVVLIPMFLHARA